MGIVVAIGALLAARPLMTDGPTADTVVAQPSASVEPIADASAASVPDSVVMPEVDESPTQVIDISPEDAATVGGDAVVITGSGFSDGVGVRVAGRPANEVVVLNEEKLRVVMPPGLPGDALVEVTAPDSAQILGEGLVNYVERAPRVVMAIRPNIGPVAGGTQVTIVGTGFLPGARVVIGGERAEAVEVLDPTRIIAVTPAHEVGFVDVVVRNPELPAAILATAFEYVPAPTIRGMAPPEIPVSGGVPIRIEGRGFEDGVTVTINGLPASDVVVVNDRLLTAVAPVGVLGPATLVVENPGQPRAQLVDATFYVPDPIPDPLPEPTLEPIPEPIPEPAPEPIPAPAPGPGDPATPVDSAAVAE